MNYGKKQALIVIITDTVSFVQKCAPMMWLRLRISAVDGAHWPLNRGCALTIGHGDHSRGGSLRTL